jgi:hypothetical protein
MAGKSLSGYYLMHKVGALGTSNEHLPLGSHPSIADSGYECCRPHISCMLDVGSAPASSELLWCSVSSAKLKCLLTQTGSLWTRLGSAPKTKEKNMKKVVHRAPNTEEDDSELQRAWGALIKEKEQSRQKKSRLDNLPSLQIEVSRESSSGSEAES